ncbi:MAG: alkaline phosphatase D family protein, partial [Methylophaga sp.]
MSSTLKVGPLLGVESDADYTVCFLTEKSVTTATVTLDGDAVGATLIRTTAKGKFWRAQKAISASAKGKFVSYTINLNDSKATDKQARDRWTFYVPGKQEKPLFAYTSCNGFSSADILTKTEKPYALWEDMQGRHYDPKEPPFSLLMMGGDQLYADEIWSAVPELQKWSVLDKSEKTARSFNATMCDQVDRFYEHLYCQRWDNPAMSLMMASIPTVMMWDDHDIFDGWGSYPEGMHECDVYQGIYEIAKQYFELFQIRSRQNQSLLDNQAHHYAFGFQFRDYHILALDNRAERTLEQVMSSNQWQVVNDYLDKKANNDDLLVMSAVPVVYRDFSFTEASFDTTPWEEELTDDLKDHWRSKEHQGERARLIMRLLQNAEKRYDTKHQKTVILSGDVHLGCLGVVNDSRKHDRPLKIHQVVSSGILHPSPSRIAWLGIMAVTNDRDEFL